MFQFIFRSGALHVYFKVVTARGPRQSTIPVYEIQIVSTTYNLLDHYKSLLNNSFNELLLNFVNSKFFSFFRAIPEIFNSTLKSLHKSYF